jgi:hypothetical protein
MHGGMGSGIAGRRQGSEGNMFALGRRSSVADVGESSLPKRQDSQGSMGGENRK